jgi:hypothetical protein
VQFIAALSTLTEDNYVALIGIFRLNTTQPPTISMESRRILKSIRPYHRSLKKQEFTPVSSLILAWGIPILSSLNIFIVWNLKLKYQHAVAIAIKAIIVRNGLPVAIQHQFAASQRTSKHEQGRAGQVKIGYQSIQHPKFEAWINE